MKHALTYDELSPEDRRRIDTFCSIMATAILRKMEANLKNPSGREGESGAKHERSHIYSGARICKEPRRGR